MGCGWAARVVAIAALATLLASSVTDARPAQEGARDALQPAGNDRLGSVQDVILLATKSLASLEGEDPQEVASSLIPVLELVEGMLKQTKNVSLEEIELQHERRASDSAELGEKQSAVEDLRARIDMIEMKISVLARERSDAQQLLETSQTQLTDLEQRLLNFDEVCLAEVAPLQRQASHIVRDLDLLDALSVKLSEITAKANSTTNSSSTRGEEIALLLQQIKGVALDDSDRSHLLSKPSPEDSLQNLLEVSEGAESPGNDASRIKLLLTRLTDELYTVLRAHQEKIVRIRSNCTAQETNLTSTREVLRDVVATQQEIVSSRSSESAAVHIEETVLKHNATIADSQLKSLVESIQKRDHVADALIRHRQGALLVLIQMKSLLTTYIDSLSAAAQLGNAVNATRP